MNSWIDRVVGRIAEDVSAPLDAPPGAASTPEPRQSRQDYDEEAGNTPVEDVPSETVVSELLQAWHNGQQNEVAAQLLFTPVSYADFVKLCFAIGQSDAVSLGLLLDDLAESEGMVTDQPDQNKLLGQGQPPRNLGGGPSEAPGPTGGEPQVPEATAQAADRKLPPPPPQEEPEEPHEVP